MILAIIVDKDLSDLSPGEKISTIKTLARVLNIPPVNFYFHMYLMPESISRTFRDKSTSALSLKLYWPHIDGVM